MNDISLENMNRHMRDNIKALMSYLAVLRCKKFPKVAEDHTTIVYKDNPKYDPEKYEKLADGFGEVHALLLAHKEKYRSAWTATWNCRCLVVKELQFVGRQERPGFEAAKNIFDKRLARKL